MWTCWWCSAAVLAVMAEGAVRVPLHIGHRNSKVVESELPPDVQKLGTILNNVSIQPWPQTLYSMEISANTSSWSDIKMSLANGYDNIYFFDAQVGTPAQSEQMIVDTGSSDMWLVKSSYSADTSSTSTSVKHSEITIRYGMGAMSGSQAKDRVCFANLCIDNQSFVVAMHDTTHVSDMTDGLFGLAFPALAEGSGTPALQNLASSGPFTNFSFALSLRHWDDIEQSSIVIGDLQEVLAEAPSGAGVTMHCLGVMNPITREILPPMFWAVATYVSVGLGQQALLPAILDSGTSLIAVPADEFTQLLYTMIPYQKLQDCVGIPGQPFLCPCGIPMQSLQLAFKGADGSHLKISLTAEDLLIPTPVTLLRPGPDGLAVTQACRLGIAPGPPTMNGWILGDVFLRKVYAVHDVFGLQVTLFPQTLPSVGLNGVTVAAGILSEHAGQQAIHLVLLFTMAVAFTFTFAACSRFHGQARVSEMDGYHHF